MRALSITRKGGAKFEQAVPLWREARAGLRSAIGAETMAALTDLLDRSSRRLVTGGYAPLTQPLRQGPPKGRGVLSSAVDLGA